MLAPNCNFFQKYLIPTDSLLVRSAMHHAEEQSGVNRFKATAYAFQAVLLTFPQIPQYVLVAPFKFTASLLNGDIRKAVYEDIILNAVNVVKSIVFVAASVFFIAIGLIFPKIVYPYLSPQRTLVPAEAPAVAQPRPATVLLGAQDEAQAEQAIRMLALQAELSKAQREIIELKRSAQANLLRLQELENTDVGLRRSLENVQAEKSGLQTDNAALIAKQQEQSLLMTQLELEIQGLRAENTSLMENQMLEARRQLPAPPLELSAGLSSMPLPDSSARLSGSFSAPNLASIAEESLLVPAEAAASAAGASPSGRLSSPSYFLASARGYAASASASVVSAASSVMSAANRVANIGKEVYFFFLDGKHPSKEHKYRLAMVEYAKALTANSVDLSRELNRIGEIQKGLALKDNDLLVFYKNFAELINCLTNVSNVKEVRENYKKFVQLLRALIELPMYIGAGGLKDEDPSIHTDNLIYYSKLIRKICLIRWSGLEIYSYLKGIVDVTVGALHKQQPALKDELQGLTDENFSTIIQKYNEQVANAPRQVKKPEPDLWKQKLMGEYGNEDFTGNMNLPHVRSTFVYQLPNGETKRVVYIRHGSPTMREGKLGVKIVSDYEVFIDAAKENNENILYCVHQSIIPKSVEKAVPLVKGCVASESGRVKEILNLQSKHDNFHAFVQPLQGHLFQKKRLNFNDLIKDLVTEFSPSFTAEDSRTARLPEKLRMDKEYMTRTMIPMLHAVRDIFFKGQEEITDIHEQQTFILLFYAFQKIDLKQRLNITYYTTPCKDFLDRGGCMALVEERLHDYLIDKQSEERKAERREEVVTNTIAPPILVKKMEMIPERLEQGSAVDQFLYKFSQSEENMKALRAYNFGMKPLDILVEKREGQLWAEEASSPVKLVEVESP